MNKPKACRRAAVYSPSVSHALSHAMFPCFHAYVPFHATVVVFHIDDTADFLGSNAAVPAPREFAQTIFWVTIF